ncbi:hypothetical protein D3C72_1657440 [compost metagenome]
MRKRKSRKQSGTLAPSGMAVLLRAQPWKLNSIFSPFELLLDRIDSGREFEITADGIVRTSLASDGEAYDVAESVTGLADVFDIAKSRDESCPSPAPLRLFAQKIRSELSVGQQDIRDCRACLADLRRYTSGLPTNVFLDVMQTAMLKFALDESTAA